MSRDLKTSTRSSSTTSLNSNCLSKRLRVLIAEDNIINLKVNRLLALHFLLIV